MQFVAGLFAGGTLGFIAAALLVAAGRSGPGDA